MHLTTMVLFVTFLLNNFLLHLSIQHYVTNLLNCTFLFTKHDNIGNTNKTKTESIFHITTTYTLFVITVHYKMFVQLLLVFSVLHIQLTRHLLLLLLYIYKLICRTSCKHGIPNFFGRPVNKLNYKMKDNKKNTSKHNMNILDPQSYNLGLALFIWCCS